METSQNDLPESLTRLDVRLVLSRIPIVAYSTTATLDDVLHVQEALRNLALEHHEAEPATCPCHLVDHDTRFRDGSELLEISPETWGICTRRAGNLYKARSRLYRSQILQVNIRWKALAEIYTKHSFAPFLNLNISAKNRQHFFAIEKLNFR